jgi:hypothetical protein
LARVGLALGALSLTPWTRLVLLCVLVGLALGLVISLIYIRRLRRAAQRRLTVVPSTRPRTGPLPVALTPRTSLAAARTRERGGAGGGLALAASTTASIPGRMGCPSCRREFEAGVRFCTFDSRRLVPLAEVALKSRVAGSVCPRCRRAYDAGIRYCPHDAEELMPLPLWEATHGKKQAGEPTGVLAKICPQCAVRYDLVSSFCGRDGAELMTIN